MSLLPALHYALLGFSRHVTSSLSTAGHDLQAKSDSRFVENAWRALREEFSYNPALTPSQFLSPGFAERKLMLLHDAVELCKRRHNEHARERRARETRDAVNKDGVPRVARIAAAGNNSSAKNAKDETAKSSAIQIQRMKDDHHVEPSMTINASSHQRTTGLVTRHEVARRVDNHNSYAHLPTETEHSENLVLTMEPGGNQIIAESQESDDFDFAFRPHSASHIGRSPVQEYQSGDESLTGSTRAPLTEVDSPTEPWFARSAERGRGQQDFERKTEESSQPSQSDDVTRVDNPTEFPPLRDGLRRSGGYANENYNPSECGVYEETVSDQSQTVYEQSQIVSNMQTVSEIENVEFSPEFEKKWMERMTLAIEQRVADSERAAAVAVDSARAAERIAESAVTTTKEFTQELTQERKNIAHLASALAEQTAKNLLLEKRMRSLEGRSNLEEENKENTFSQGSVLSKLSERSQNTESQVENEMLRYVGTFGVDESPAASGGRTKGVETFTHTAPRVSMTAGVSSSQAKPKSPVPADTRAFIDFYSGVLGVDRKELTLKR